MVSAGNIKFGLFFLLTEVARWTECFNCEYCRDADVCETVVGTLRYSVMSKGYNPVVTIPRGACFINVTESGKTDNVLALKNEHDYIINGHWKMSPAGDYAAAGTTLSYRKSEGACPGECIIGTGPTLAKLVVQLLYHVRNPGVHYSYQVARHLKHLPDERSPDVTSLGEKSELRESSIGYKTIPDSDTHSEGEGQKGSFPEFVPIPGGMGVHHRGPIFSSDFTHRRHESRVDDGVPTERRRQGSSRDPRRRQELRDVTYSRGPHDDTNSIETPTGHIKFSSTDDILSRGRDTNTIEDSRRNGLVSVIETYAWRLHDYTECTRPCGGGIQETIYECMDVYSHQKVTDDHCGDTIKPDTRHRVCNNEPCTPQWIVGTWSACSVTCGGGLQSRDVTCQQRITATDYQQIADSYCTSSSKPARRRDCYRVKCYGWVTGNWSDCSVECGQGTRRRQVQCQDEAGLVANNNLCSQSAPPKQEACDADHCGISEWYVGQWIDKCSENCGSGVVTRSVVCISETGHVLDDSVCESQAKPASEKQCQEETICGGKWFSGAWSGCSQSCGDGVRTRLVFCMKKNGNQYISVSDTDCQTEDKPKTSKNCSAESCGHKWFQSHWSSCSKSCGGGIQTRSVMCIGIHEDSPGTCNNEDKPDESQKCNTYKCWTGSANCNDKYSSCAVVVEASLCRYPYYQRKCCRSCGGYTKH